MRKSSVYLSIIVKTTDKLNLFCKAMKLFTALFALLLFTTTQAAIVTSVGSGNWNTPGTWDCGCIPAAGDDIIINSDHNVTANIDASPNSITLLGPSGFAFTTLALSANVTLNVTGDITLNSGTFFGSLLAFNTGASISVTNITFVGATGFVRSQINMGGANTSMLIGGNFTLPTNQEVLVSSTTSTINFRSSVAQTIPYPSTFSYHNILVNNDHFSGATLGGAITTSNLTGNLSVNQGLFNNGGFSIQGNGSATFTVADETTFLLSGTSSFPTGFGTNTIEAGSTIEYGGGNQAIDILPGGIDYSNLTVSGTGTKTLTSGGNRNVIRTLTVSSGTTLDLGTTADQIVLVSDASGTARLGEVTGTITGTGMTVQRHVGGTATNWRFLGSPCSGQTLADWSDNFITSGFPGSDFPSFPFTSIQTYDESVLGGFDDGYVIPTDISDAINVGEGYWAYLGPTPIALDVTGTPNFGTINLPVTFNSSGNIDDDGWNLVCNPVASEVDWTNVTKGAGITDQYWIYDPASGNFANWNEGTGVGTNGANGIIAHSQAFWVKLTSSSTLSVPESSKTSTAAGEFFRRSQSNFDLLRFKVASDINGYSDEAVVAFVPGVDANFDTYDSRKIASPETAAPQLSFLSNDGKELSVASIAENPLGTTLPLNITVGVSGTYTLSLEDLDHALTNICFELEDLVTGEIIDIRDEVYTFTTTTGAAGARFALRFTEYVDAAISANTDSVFLSQNTDVVFSNSTIGASNYNWNFGDGYGSTNMSPIHAYEQVGTYEVTMTATAGECFDEDQLTVHVLSGVSVPETEQLLSDGFTVSTTASEVLVRFDYLTEAQVGITLYNIGGQAIYRTESVTTGSSIFQIPMTDVPHGVYIITIEGEQGNASKKFVY